MKCRGSPQTVRFSRNRCYYCNRSDNYSTMRVRPYVISITVMDVYMTRTGQRNRTEKRKIQPSVGVPSRVHTVFLRSETPTTENCDQRNRDRPPSLLSPGNTQLDRVRRWRITARLRRRDSHEYSNK